MSEVKGSVPPEVSAGFGLFPHSVSLMNGSLLLAPEEAEAIASQRCSSAHESDNSDVPPELPPRTPSRMANAPTPTLSNGGSRGSRILPAATLPAAGSGGLFDANERDQDLIFMGKSFLRVGMGGY